MIPPKIAIESTLKIGTIYKFKAPELINTDIPHYFIVIAIESSDNFMVVCTTQLDNKIEQFKKMNYSMDTLAYIKPSQNNGLKSDTYVNCNEYHTVTKNQLIAKVQTDKFEISGDLSKEEFDSIKKCVGLSYTFDLPRHLVIHPDDTK